MSSLNRALIGTPGAIHPSIQMAEPKKRPVRIVQFGEGNFLRAFVDWMVDVINERELFDGSIAMLQPIPQGLGEMINDQDGLYTLLLRGIQNGEVEETRRIITSVESCLNPYEDWEGLMALARDPLARYVVSNTTEAGIVYDHQEFTKGECPASFPAKVTAYLHERFKALGGTKKSGIVFLPCELIDRNGDKLKTAVKLHAEDWKLGEAFMAWLESACIFTNTLVDRIVPGYPREEIDSITQALGYEDKLIDAGEIFHLWVIEGPQELAEELPFHKAGMNVIWTDDMAPYRTRKVRVLNGAHTSSVLGAFLGGLETVGEMMKDETFGAMLRVGVFEEILSILDLPEREKLGYAEALIERFGNPFIRHELISISLNSVSKWSVRVLPSILDYVEKHDELPLSLTYSLAVLLRFYKGQQSGDREMTGEVDAKSYPIRDDADVLEFMESAWAAHDGNGDTSALVTRVLSEPSLWGQDLTVIEGLETTVTAYLDKILINGSRAAADDLLQQSTLS